MLPAEARHRPMMVRRHVVLPAPLRPRSMVREFGSTPKSTPCRMWYCPMRVLTPRSASSSATRHPQIGFLDDRRGDDLGGCAIGDELALMDVVRSLADRKSVV